MAKLSVLFCMFVFVVLCLGDLCAAEEKIDVFELKKGDFSVKITNYGAVVLSMMLPDKNGKVDDVVLGFDSLNDYKNDSTYFGALVGRVANRIGGARFTLNGVQYRLPANDHDKNTLHGGTRGFSDVIWTVKSYDKGRHLTLNYVSPDGDQGFPGELSVTVTYMLFEKNKLGIEMVAVPKTKATPVNLASHTYFNLDGHASGDILSHKVQLFASKITPTDESLIPTGAIDPVQGTPYDFLQPRTVGSRINSTRSGYDINYVVDDTGNQHLKKVARVEGPKSGRIMELWSDKPGVQFYTSNMLSDTKGKGGVVYHKYGGIALETQGFPDSVNHPNFPSQIVNPGETYKHTMVYRFTAPIAVTVD